MPNVTANYGRFTDSIAFLGNILQHVRNDIPSSNFHELCVYSYQIHAMLYPDISLGKQKYTNEK